MLTDVWSQAACVGVFFMTRHVDTASVQQHHQPDDLESCYFRSLLSPPPHLLTPDLTSCIHSAAVKSNTYPLHWRGDWATLSPGDPHRRQSLRRSALQDHLFSWGNLFLSGSLRKYHNSYLTTFSLFLWLSVELNLLCHRVFGCVGLIQGCSDPCRCFWHRGVCLQLAGLSGTCEQAGRRHKLIIQSPGGLDSSHYISSCSLTTWTRHE